MPIVTSGLVGYWNSKQGVDGNTWQNIAPATKGNYNSLIIGATVTPDGMYFDGVDDKVNVPLPSDINKVTSFTMEFRLKLSNYNGYPDIMADNRGYTIYLDSVGGMRLVLQFQSVAGVNHTFVNNNEYYFSIVYNTNGSLLVFINGQKTTTSARTNDRLFQSSSFVIGSPESYHPRGIIDNIRFYNRTLTDTEVGQNYAVRSSVGLDEEPPPGTEHIKTLTESIAITDSIINRSISKRITDSVSTTENITVIPPDIPNVYTKELIDAVAFNEAFTKSAYTEKILNDSLIADDSVSKNFTVAIMDQLNTNEQNGNSVDRNINDTLNINDSLAQEGKNRANLSDQITITDAISKAFTKMQSDSVDAVESPKEYTAKELFEDLIPIDSITFTEGKAILLTDSLMSSESIDKAIHRLQSDLVDLSDSVGKQSNVSVRLYDVVVYTDEIIVFNPNAPQYIGTINLKGKRELYVYLKAKHELNVRLKARQELIIHLKGRIDMTMENQNFSIYSGDTKYIRFPIEGVPDLNGLSISWSVSKHKNAGNPTITKRTNDGNITIVDNEVQIKIEPEDTANLSGPYYHECKITDSFGNHSKVMTGHLSIK